MGQRTNFWDAVVAIVTSSRGGSPQDRRRAIHAATWLASLRVVAPLLLGLLWICWWRF